MPKLGLRTLDDPRRHEFAKFMLLDAATEATMPPKLDYLSIYPPVDNQGEFGTCVAFGTKKVLEAFYHRQFGRNVVISARALFSQIKAQFYPGDSADEGAQVSDGLRVLEAFYCVEPDFPYLITGTFDQFLHGVPANIKRYTDLLFHSFVAVPPNVTAIKMALFQHGPVAIGGPWANEWMEIGADGRLPGSNLTLAGGHCVSLLGYDDTFTNLDGSKGAFLGVNNWGDGWGHSGYFYLPYNSQFLPSDVFTVAV